MLLRRGEQEHGVVHRDREDHREEEDGRPGVEEALRLEAEQPGAVAVLEDQPSDAEGGADGEQVGEHAEGGDQRRLQRDEQEQEAEDEHDADHERRLRRERLFEVVVLGGGAADERPGGQGGAEPVDRAADALLDGSAFGVAWISASPLPPSCGAARRGDARIAACDRCDTARPRRVARRSGARRARRRRRPAAPACSRCASRRSSGTTLIDGMPVFSPRTGRASSTRTSVAAGP